MILLTSGNIPEAYSLVKSPRDQKVGGWAKVDTEHKVRVALEDFSHCQLDEKVQLRIASRIPRRSYLFHTPYPNCLVVRCRCKKFSVVRPSDIRDSFRMSLQRLDEFTMFHIPDLDDLVSSFYT